MALHWMWCFISSVFRNNHHPCFQLAESELFQSAAEGFLNAVLEHLSETTLLPGDILFAQGDIGDHMYFIDSGPDAS